MLCKVVNVHVKIVPIFIADLKWGVAIRDAAHVVEPPKNNVEEMIIEFLTNLFAVHFLLPYAPHRSPITVSDWAGNWTFLQDSYVRSLNSSLTK